MRTGSAEKRMKTPPRPCGVLRMTDMRCPGCGAEMHLIEVAPDKTKMVPGYEQHTFECSGCHDHVRQLVFIPRAIGPLNSEEMRLSAAWLETLNKGTTPKGDDLARAVRAVSPIKAMYVVAGQRGVKPCAPPSMPV